MRAVPETLEEAISPEWLTRALSDRWPGTVVASVEPDTLLHGVGTKALVTLTYTTRPSNDLPSSVCVKAGYEPHNRHILESGTYMKEARFYREVACDLPVVTPTCLYAAYDTTSKQGVIVMENLNLAGAVFGSAQRGYT